MKSRPLTLCFFLCMLSLIYLWKVSDKWKTVDKTTRKIPEINSQTNHQTPLQETELVENNPASRAQASTEEGHDFNSIRRMMQRDPGLTVSFLRPDGSEKVNLRGTYQTASMARLKSDGSIEVTCFESFKPARDFLLYRDTQTARQNASSAPKPETSFVEK
ncbi:MAG: hypothetical protein AAGH40_11755 [Verrucomicrobiota bacterium]